MTKRKPKRGAGGKFTGQAPRKASRPDAPPTPAPRSDGQAPAAQTAAIEKLAPTGQVNRLRPPPGWMEKKTCEECGTEYLYRTVRIGRAVLDVGSCPRCTPDPVRIMQGE